MRDQHQESRTQSMQYSNQWDDSGYRRFNSNPPQFNPRIQPAPYDPPLNYFPPNQAPHHPSPPPPPPPPPPPTTTPQPSGSREDLNHWTPYYQNI